MESMQVLRELSKMPALIKADALAWKQCVHKGAKYTRLYTATCANVFDTETQCDSSNTEEQLRCRRLLLQRLFKRLNTIYNELTSILNALADIQRRTQRMLYRVRLWNDDELLRKHHITWDLTTSMLLEFLEFLQLRYDCEWEVKEMVVLELRKMTNNEEGSLLVKIWQNNSHAGGIEFETRLHAFFQMTGQSGALFPSSSGFMPVLANECKCKCNCAAQQSDSPST